MCACACVCMCVRVHIDQETFFVNSVMPKFEESRMDILNR